MMRPYFSELLRYTFADSDRFSDDGFGLNLGFGKNFNQYWGMEIGGWYQRFDQDGPSNPVSWREYGLELDALFYWQRKPSFSPYFLMGLGAAHNDVKGTGISANDPFANVGLGFITRLTEHVNFRADARYRYIDSDDDFGGNSFSEPIISAGLTFALGQIAPPPVSTPAVGCPDADSDGVCDASDACPGTPRGVRVDAKGCPLDSDGDGVPDYLDKCPGTPRGTPVDKDGCPLTPCSEEKFEDVNFAFDKSNLTDYAAVTLDKTIEAIRAFAGRCPNYSVTVDGHTDSVGTDAYNMALGERRAKVVRDYLTRKGVDGARITTRSFGESKPIASNETAKGRLLNRRSEVRARQ